MIQKLFLAFILFFGINVSAQTDQFIPEESSYLFYLFYDGGRLVVDREAQYPYDVVALPANEEAGPFKADVRNFKGQVQLSVTFNLEEGKAEISVPYIANAKEIYFYDAQGIRLLSLDLSGSSFCNDDNVCNQDAGENFRACPNDCEAINLPAPTPGEENGVISNTQGKPLLPVLVIVGLIISAAIIFYRFWIRNKSSTT